jgi:phage terminase small subunit
MNKRAESLEDLTDRQRKFIVEMAKDGVVAAAARRAGYNGSNRNLYIRGRKLLANPVIAEAVRKQAESLFQKLEITAADVIRELACVATLDPRDLYDIDAEGNSVPKPLHMIPDRARRAIKSIKVRRTRGQKDVEVIALEVWDKVEAAQVLGRIMGLLKGDGQHVNIVVDAEKARRAKVDVELAALSAEELELLNERLVAAQDRACDKIYHEIIAARPDPSRVPQSRN